jgi:hypothetical protein
MCKLSCGPFHVSKRLLAHCNSAVDVLCILAAYAHIYIGYFLRVLFPLCILMRLVFQKSRVQVKLVLWYVASIHSSM